MIFWKYTLTSISNNAYIVLQKKSIIKIMDFLNYKLIIINTHYTVLRQY